MMPPTLNRFAARTTSLVFGPLLLASTLLLSVPAGAQTARDKALAEELFQQGRSLIEAGKLEEACSRFEKSQKLEQKLGTLLNLASCHEQLGRTASAWAEFKEAATLADNRGEMQRADFARKHAGELNGKLSKVIINNDNPGVSLSVRLDNTPLLVDVLGVPLPLDPGEHVLDVSAPDKKPQKVSFNVPAGPSSSTVVIPLLEALPKPASTVVPVRLVPLQPAPKNEDSGVPVYAIVGFSVGGAALLVGAITGGMSLSMAGDLEASCLNQTCTGTDADDLSSANTLGNVSNISFGVAAVGAIVGVIGVVAGGSSSGERAALTIVPVGDVGAGIRLSF